MTPKQIPEQLPKDWQLHHITIPNLRVDEFWVVSDVIDAMSCCGKPGRVAYPVDSDTHTVVRNLENTFIDSQNNGRQGLREDGGVCHCATQDKDGLRWLSGLIAAYRAGIPPMIAEIMMAMPADAEVEVENADGTRSVTSQAITAGVTIDEILNDDHGECDDDCDCDTEGINIVIQPASEPGQGSEANPR